MKNNDTNLNDELKEVRNEFIQIRWSQLYNLSKDKGEEAVKYLLTTNAGGAIAVLTYLGAVNKNAGQIDVNISLIFFFIGIISVGIMKAYNLHSFEGLFSNYQKLVSQYYNNKIDWDTLIEKDEEKVGNSIVPYLLGYVSFGSFILGSLIGVYNIIFI